MEKFNVSWKFLLGASCALVGIFVFGVKLWSEQMFAYIWLFVLSMWALLHVKKSVGTWGKFDEIDQRDSDFSEEVDRRLDELTKQVKALQPKRVRKPRKKKEEDESLPTSKEDQE